LAPARFNNKAVSSLKQLKVETKWNGTKNVNTFIFNDILSESQTHTILDTISASNNLLIKNISLKAKKDSINIDNLTFNTKIEKISLKGVKNLIQLIQQNKNSPKELQSTILDIINKGLSFKIDPLSIKSAHIDIKNSNPIDVDKLKINFTTTLQKNNYSFQRTPEELLNYTDAHLVLKTTQKNIEILNSFNPAIQMYLNAIIKKDKNNVTIDISYKNGKIFANGTQLF